jgi:hypothetical protein
MFLCTTASKSALRPTQPPIRWVSGALSVGTKQPGQTLTSHLHLEQRSRILWAIPPLLQHAFMAWCSVKNENRDYFTFTLLVISAVTCLTISTQVVLCHFTCLTTPVLFEYKNQGNESSPRIVTVQYHTAQRLFSDKAFFLYWNLEKIKRVVGEFAADEFHNKLIVMFCRRKIFV